MNLSSRIDAFEHLGFVIKTALINIDQNKYQSSDSYGVNIQERISLAFAENSWFIPEFINNALHEIGKMLERKNLIDWLSVYNLDMLDFKSPKNVAIVMAGNLPLVGFHDLLAVLISGHKVLIKLSQKDAQLPRMIGDLLMAINPKFKKHIAYVDGIMSDYDAVIATGSNNTRRYFEYYFKKVPHIIRGQKNSVAVLMGNESDEQLNALADDLFLYFGLGCRSVSQLYLPMHYSKEKLFPYFERYHTQLNMHHKYMNNYLYQKSIMMVNKVPFLDDGVVMITENENVASPISVIHLAYYSSINDLIKKLDMQKNVLQCVVTDNEFFPNAIKFGQSQKPTLLNYADDVDLIKFLIDIKN